MSTHEASASDHLVSFVDDLDYDDCPPAAIETARRSLIDTVGVTLAGGGEDAPETVHDYVASVALDGDCTVIGREERYPPEFAASLNGVQGHVLDYDDVCYYSFSIHPSVTLVPTLLALGERENASGRDLLAAFVAGFEAEIRLPGGVGAALQDDGYHPTAIVGTFGATLTAAKLVGLSPGEMKHALGIAASLYSGVAANYGTMVKSFHAGIANQHGIRAVELARRGFTANDAVFDTDSGPWPAPYDAFDLGAWTDDLAERWYAASGIGIKLYPACGCTHGGIDAALALRDEVDDWREIDSIRVGSTSGGMYHLPYADPETPLEAKFSMEYVVSAALVDGDVTLQHFTAAGVERADVRSLVDRTTHVVDDTLGGESYVDGGWPARLEVTLTDGTTLERTVRQSTGTAAVEVTDEQLWSKFEECVAASPAGFDDPRGVFDSLSALESVEDVSSLVSSLGV